MTPHSPAPGRERKRCCGKPPVPLRAAAHRVAQIPQLHLPVGARGGDEARQLRRPRAPRAVLPGGPRHRHASNPHGVRLGDAQHLLARRLVPGGEKPALSGGEERAAAGGMGGAEHLARLRDCGVEGSPLGVPQPDLGTRAAPAGRQAPLAGGDGRRAGRARGQLRGGRRADFSARM